MKNWEGVPPALRGVFVVALVVLFYFCADFAAEFYNQIVRFVAFTLHGVIFSFPKEPPPSMTTVDAELRGAAQYFRHRLWAGALHCANAPSYAARALFQLAHEVAEQPHLLVALAAVAAAALLLLLFFVAKVAVPLALLRQKTCAGDAATREKKE